ncbi:MAG: UbiA family prenyltransferase, partial [Thermoplasmatota archaeon]
KGFQGNVVIAVMVFLPFILGASISGITPIIIILCIMAFLTSLAKEIINDVKDIEGDRGYRSTLPNTMGIKRSLAMARILLVLVILISLVPVMMLGIDIIYLIFIGMADLLLIVVMFTSYHRPVLAHRLHSAGMVLSLPAFLSLSI